MAYGPYGKIHRLVDDYEMQDMEMGLLPGSAYMMGLRLSPLSTRSGTAAEIVMIDNERMVFGSSTDAYITWDASNMVVTQATARTGLVKLSNVGMSIGVSGTPIDLSTSTTYRGLEVYTTSASTNGGTSIRPVFMYSIMTGAGGVGGRAEFHTYTAAALGGWCNAIKGYLEFGTGGSTSGLASAVVAEMKTQNASLGAGGAYMPLEVELVYGGTSVVSAGSLSGNHVAFSTYRFSGDADGDFDDNGFWMTTTGLTNGANHVLSASSHTLRVGVGTTTRYLVLSATQNGLGLGASGSNVSFSQGSPLLSTYSTCSSTSGASSVEYMYSYCDMTGPGGVGGRARFHTYTNVTLGGWCNALKSYMEFGSSGRITGLASSMCAEMVMPNANVTAAGGGYFPLEVEYVAGGTSLTTAGALSGNHVGFIYMAQSGDAGGDFDANGFILSIDGMTAGANNAFRTGLTAGTINAATTAALRIGVNDTIYYIPIATATA